MTSQPHGTPGRVSLLTGYLTLAEAAKLPSALGRRRQEWQYRTETAARRQLEAVQRRLARGQPVEEGRMTVMARSEAIDEGDVRLERAVSA